MMGMIVVVSMMTMDIIVVMSMMTMRVIASWREKVVCWRFCHTRVCKREKEC